MKFKLSMAIKEIVFFFIYVYIKLKEFFIKFLLKIKEFLKFLIHFHVLKLCLFYFCILFLIYFFLYPFLHNFIFHNFLVVFFFSVHICNLHKFYIFFFLLFSAIFLCTLYYYLKNTHPFSITIHQQIRLRRYPIQLQLKGKFFTSQILSIHPSIQQQSIVIFQYKSFLDSYFKMS